MADLAGPLGHLCPLDRLESVAGALSALAVLVGQAEDLDCAGRDGLSYLLELVRAEIVVSAGALRGR